MGIYEAWKKQYVGEDEVHDVTQAQVARALNGRYRNPTKLLRHLPLGQKLRTPMAYYWREESR